MCPLLADYVSDLAESIAALGLIAPLVVDASGALLAGAHRLAAIQTLKQTDPELHDERFPGELI